MHAVGREGLAEAGKEVSPLANAAPRPSTPSEFRNIREKGLLMFQVLFTNMSRASTIT
jgi:hypothetical protein